MTLVLLLRAVNLGKTNKVPMKQLMEKLRGAGLGDPSYLLQSGNVIVSGSPLAPEDLKRAVERLILEEFGVETVAIGRTPAQLARVVADNPFATPDGGSVQVALWDEPAPAELIEALAQEAFAGAQLYLTTTEAYMRYDSASHSSKLNNQLVERRLGVMATARNVRTLERLLALEQLTEPFHQAAAAQRL